MMRGDVSTRQGRRETTQIVPAPEMSSSLVNERLQHVFEGLYRRNIVSGSDFSLERLETLACSCLTIGVKGVGAAIIQKDKCF